MAADFKSATSTNSVIPGLGKTVLVNNNKKGEAFASPLFEFGAGDESRTRDLNLGKVALYQLSYSRSVEARGGIEPP